MRDTSQPSRVVVVVGREPPSLENEAEIESNYVGSEALNSCSSIDEDELIHTKPKYLEFNECDMKDLEFKIGMKFRSFKQFKDAVKNYGIKNSYMMNFKPNSQKCCKAFCKKNCPFYLWASPMVKDGNIVQIKAGKLKHECAKDNNNRHFNAQWIAKTYLE